MATILIVDVNSTDRRSYITLLSNFGHRLLEADDGIKALELARVELPDLIITDVLMPNMDGFALVRGLQAEPLLAGVPIIFHTTNYDESEIHRHARASGVQHILRKPAEPHEILRAVNESLKYPITSSRPPNTGQLHQAHLQLLIDKLYQKVSELEKANEHLRNVSLTDGLTGLNNRRGFMILATGLLKFARRAGYPLCLLYIDLDSLKYINNTFGHTAGDMAISHFARILTETFRDSDVIGRMGGDEFVILLTDATESDIVGMRALLQRNVDTHNLQAGRDHALSFSLGVIRININSTETMEALLSQADTEMYKHKRARKDKTGS